MTEKLILVTGGAGFIGSNIVRALNARGEDNIILVDDLSDGNKSKKSNNLSDLKISEYIDYKDLLTNLTNPSYDYLKNISCVFHQGACTDTTEWDGKYMMESNCLYSKTLLDWALAHQIHFIYASSASVYGTGNSFIEEMVVSDLFITPKLKKKLSPKTKIRSYRVPAALSKRKNYHPLTTPVYLKKREVEDIFSALVLGTRDYIYKNGFSKVVLGLSGGIDSALTAVIATKALGKENVIGVLMPSPYSSEGSTRDSLHLAKNLGIDTLKLPIEKAMIAYDKILGKVFSGTTSGLAEENLQARIRGNLLMALSNKKGGIVLTTGNKSEISVGYCTLYGDMAGGFAVIKDVPKVWVYKISRWLNKEQEIIPESIITKEPSAELRPDQKDTDSLPPYDLFCLLYTSPSPRDATLSRMPAWG